MFIAALDPASIQYMVQYIRSVRLQGPARGLGPQLIIHPMIKNPTPACHPQPFGIVCGGVAAADPIPYHLQKIGEPLEMAKIIKILINILLALLILAYFLRRFGWT